MVHRLLLLAAASVFSCGGAIASSAPAPELAGSVVAAAAEAPVSADAFLQRQRQPVATPSSSGDAGGSDVRASHRFDMTQNGRRMTAAEFDAWMKARGIRVATGKPAGSQPAAADAATATATADAPACQPTITTTC